MNPQRATTAVNPITQSVMRTNAAVIARKCACGQLSQGGECAACRARKKLNLRRKTNTHANSTQVTSSISGSINEVLASPGQALELTTRTFMESRFGRDFSQVRVHNHAKAWESANAIDAQAYTFGSNIVFGAGFFSPRSPSGQRLLAHELTHVVQQSGGQSPHQAGVQRQYQLGAVNDSSERQADIVADAVMSPLTTDKPLIHPTAGPLLRRTPRRYTKPQQLGRDHGRLATLDAPARGKDKVEVHVIRYIEACPCRQVNYQREGVFYNPELNNLAIAYRYCIGGTTADAYARLQSNAKAFLGGTAPPQGTARVGIDVNLRGRRSGGRILVEAIGTNEGTGDGVGGRALLVYQGSRWRVFLEPQFIRRLRDLGGSTQNELKLSLGAQIGDVTVRLDALNILDPTRSQTTLSVCPIKVGSVSLCATGQLGPSGEKRLLFEVRTPLDIPKTERAICRNCFCPAPVRIYECIEDVLPRDEPIKEKVPVPHEHEYRYYFRLDTVAPSESSSLRAQSTRNLDALAAEVQAGGSVSIITGYASPEATERHNAALSKNRGVKMRQLVQSRVGANVETPEPSAGGELLGRRPEPTPSSRLGQAIHENGFRSAEDLSYFLRGEEIPNKELGQQFVSLFNALPEPADRLAVFGLTPSDPIAPQVLAAVQRYLRTGGRGYRPWERIFRLLRYAVAKVVRIVPEVRARIVSHTGSVDWMARTQCQPYIDRAEQAKMFGPVDPKASRPTTKSEDSNSDCLLKPKRTDIKKGCKYDLPENMKKPFAGPSYAPKRLR